ncbi:MAG: hypothetical protein AAF901_07185 [Bacteroidota bacterium]
MEIDERRLGEIFKNPYYCGILTSKLLPDEVVVGRHEPIVSQSDFLKINAIEINHPTTRETDNKNLPLKRFISCCECHKPLTGFLVKRKGLHYYKCRTKGCIGTKSADQLHDMFLKKLSLYHLDPKYGEILKEVMIYTYDEKTKEIRKNEAQIKKQLTVLNSKIESIKERFAIGEINIDIYEKFNTKLSKEKVELENQLKDSTISSSNLKTAIDKAIKMSSNLNKMWLLGDLKQKAKIQNLVFPSGMSYDKQNNRVQTKRVNSIFAAILLISGKLSKIKNGETIGLHKFSAGLSLIFL